MCGVFVVFFLLLSLEMIHKFSVSEDLISLPHFELFKQIHLLTHLRLLLPNFPAGKVERGRVLERRKLLL